MRMDLSRGWTFAEEKRIHFETNLCGKAYREQSRVVGYDVRILVAAKHHLRHVHPALSCRSTHSMDLSTWYLVAHFYPPAVQS